MKTTCGMCIHIFPSTVHWFVLESFEITQTMSIKQWAWVIFKCTDDILYFITDNTYKLNVWNTAQEISQIKIWNSFLVSSK